MGKRFTEALKWADPWFRGLAPEMKLAWLYLLDTCDAAGVIDLDAELANFQTKAAVDWEGFLGLCNGRVERLAGGKLWMPGFIPFQYGTLSEACMAHRPVFASLKKHGLKERVLKGYSEAINSLKDKDKEKDKKKTEGGVGETAQTDLPPILDSPEFHSVLERWRAYKGKSYKPRGLQSLLSQAAKRAEDFGLAAVVNAFETAMSNDHEGWNFESNFRKSAKTNPTGIPV